MTTSEPIIIVGAGLGGLTLANVLHRNGIDAVLYDLDASPTARDQGGMLDIHGDSGQVALRAAGLYDEFRAVIHAGGQSMRIVDRDGVLLMSHDETDDEGDRPEVNRHDLRRILLGGLPDGMIRWGARVAGVRTLDDGRHEVRFADSDTVSADLLIGADGAWSRVRPLLSSAVPSYLGISFVEADLPDAAVRNPEVAALVGGGMGFALSDGKGMLTHLETDETLHAYVALKAPVDWAETAGIDFADIAGSKAAVLEHFDGWDPRLRALIADSTGPLVLRAIHALPVGHRWDRVPGVTLLGDAAHLMSPFAGEGANLAMLDAAELATAIVAHPGDTEAALATYEKALFPRSERSAAESSASMDVCFGPDAPQSLVDMMNSYGPGTD